MRLKRILLFAVLSITMASGCSANRNSLNPLHRADDRESIAPRDEHEYDPRIQDYDRDLQEPTSPVPSLPVPSGEPVPAPPAFGVSRVKSVSWLKEITSKLHGRQSSCTADACVSDQQCETGACAAESIHDDRRSLQSLIRKKRQSAFGQDCGEYRILQRGCTPRNDESCITVDSCLEELDWPFESRGNRQNPSAMNPIPRRECLADPLQEPFAPDHVPALGIHGDPQPPTAVPELPVQPAQQNPVLPVPGVPELPISPGSSVRMTEPPAWPRHRGTAGTHRPTTRQATHYSLPPNATGTSEDLPQLIPGRKI